MLATGQPPRTKRRSSVGADGPRLLRDAVDGVGGVRRAHAALRGAGLTDEEIEAAIAAIRIKKDLPGSARDLAFRCLPCRRQRR